jgi:5-carboxymethyl-2-hydroxymuconate isomerase
MGWSVLHRAYVEMEMEMEMGKRREVCKDMFSLLTGHLRWHGPNHTVRRSSVRTAVLTG